MNIHCAWCKRSSVALHRSICRSCLESLGCEDCGRKVVSYPDGTTARRLEPIAVNLYDNGHDVFTVCADCWPHRAETFGPDREVHSRYDTGSDIPGEGAA